MSGSLGLLALSSVTTGYLFKDNNTVDEILLGMAALGLFLPHSGANVIGFFILVGVSILQKRRKLAGMR
jgi:TRAP-type uncharacterized transport system fused permease subunit